MRFVGEQFGRAEDDLKTLLVEKFEDTGVVKRSYLGRVKYRRFGSAHVMLGLVVDEEHEVEAVEDASAVYQSLFQKSQSLDIVILQSGPEEQMRRVQCPFYSGIRYPRPDFYMATMETIGLEDVRACYKEKRLSDEDGRSEYLLCEVDPVLPSSLVSDVGEIVNDRVILSSRHQGHSVFSIEEWPACLHACFLFNDLPKSSFQTPWTSRRTSDAWVEIHQTIADAKQWANRP